LIDDRQRADQRAAETIADQRAHLLLLPALLAIDRERVFGVADPQPHVEAELLADPARFHV
jgi:hypothetical protein